MQQVNNPFDTVSTGTIAPPPFRPRPFVKGSLGQAPATASIFTHVLRELHPSWLTRCHGPVDAVRAGGRSGPEPLHRQERAGIAEYSTSDRFLQRIRVSPVRDLPAANPTRQHAVLHRIHGANLQCSISSNLTGVRWQMVSAHIQTEDDQLSPVAASLAWVIRYRVFGRWRRVPGFRARRSKSYGREKWRFAAWE